MKNTQGKIAKKVFATTNGYGRLTKGKSYRVIYPSTDGNKYIFVLDETNCINGYHIRNFKI